MNRALASFLVSSFFFGCSSEDPPCPVPVAHETLDLEFQWMAPGIAIPLATDAVRIPGQPGNFFVAEQTGRVHRIDLDDESSTVVLDLVHRTASIQENWELGLYAVALHPEFETDPRAYLSLTSGSGASLRSLVLEYEVRPNGTWVEQRTLFSTPQPNPVHNGGTVRFLDDGRLGLGLGDGDEPKTSQDPDNVLGNFLAFDVDTPRSPAPFETLAVGFRNPWRFSVDPESGEVFVGDVGHVLREEVNRLIPNSNYGWPRYEGNTSDRGEAFCDDCGELRAPIVEYCQEQGTSVVTGAVYRGNAIPALRGQFMFSDFSKGGLYVFPADAVGPEPLVRAGDVPVGLTSYFEDHSGEILGITRTNGRVYLLQERDLSQQPASLLSLSGYVDRDDPAQPVEGAIRYDVRWSFFTDGAEKSRWIVPGPDRTASVDEEGDLRFPTGTALVKRFDLNGRTVETRVFLHHDDGIWRGYSYRWRADGSDANLLAFSSGRTATGEAWYYPSRSECNNCHTAAAGESLGLTLSQLDGQLDVFTEQGVLSGELPTYEAHPTPESAAALEDRARTYLDVNCGSCHRPRGGGGGVLDLRKSVPEAESGLCNVAQVSGAAPAGARIVEEGDPDSSVLFIRASSRDDNRMNPFRLTRDLAGEALLREWIETEACR